MFYRLGKKKIRKTLGGWQLPPAPSSFLYVQGLIPTVKAYHLVDICDFQVGGGGGGGYT